MAQAAKLDLRSESAIGSTVTSHAELKAKWGFLKNIVNIDTFFSNGHHSESIDKKEDKEIDKKDEKKVQLEVMDDPDQDQGEDLV